MLYTPKVVYTGLESQGKSLALARDALTMARHCVYLKKKYGIYRLLFSNLIFSDDFYNEYKDFIRYYTRIDELVNEKGCFVICDELSLYFSALKSEPLPDNVNRWLRQGAKQGVFIRGSAQEFHDLHVQFRRRVFSVYHCVKLFGSARPAVNTPPVPGVWGLVRLRPLVIEPYDELNPRYHFSLPPFDCLLITKQLVSIFNTSQVIGDVPPLPFKHIERSCPACNYKKIYHI